MRNAGCGGVEPAPRDQNGVTARWSRRYHVRTSLRLFERAIAYETPFGSQEGSANTVVLDDVPPLRASAALRENRLSDVLER